LTACLVKIQCLQTWCTSCTKPRRFRAS